MDTLLDCESSSSLRWFQRSDIENTLHGTSGRAHSTLELELNNRPTPNIGFRAWGPTSEEKY